jgi:hypothetical protein
VYIRAGGNAGRLPTILLFDAQLDVVQRSSRLLTTPAHSTYPDDPVLGTWRLNVEKSKFMPGPGWQSQTRVYRSTPAGVSVTWAGIGGRGEKMQVTYTYKYDGQDYPMAGSGSYDTLNAVRIDALTVIGKPRIKAIALGRTDAGPFIPCTRATVADRTYPLARSIFIQLNRPPDHPLSPAIREFLRYILSRQGQSAVQAQGEYLPLTRTELDHQLEALN